MSEEPTTHELNLPLDQGVLLRLHFGASQGQAVLRPDDNGLWNHRNLRKAIYDHLPKVEAWGRFKIVSVEIESYTKVILTFIAEEVGPLAEAWAMFLGDVITDPPVRDY